MHILVGMTFLQNIDRLFEADPPFKTIECTMPIFTIPKNMIPTSITSNTLLFRLWNVKSILLIQVKKNKKNMIILFRFVVDFLCYTLWTYSRRDFFISINYFLFLIFFDRFIQRLKDESTHFKENVIFFFVSMEKLYFSFWKV